MKLDMAMPSPKACRSHFISMCFSPRHRKWFQPVILHFSNDYTSLHPGLAKPICDIQASCFCWLTSNRPLPSPRNAVPRHSGRRMSSLMTRLAFSSTFSPLIQTQYLRNSTYRSPVTGSQPRSGYPRDTCSVLD